MRCFAILLTALLYPALCLLAQPLRFQNYTINNGLSQSSIKSILQDQTGFIWLATQDGLNRFDGKNFKVWKRNNKARASLSENSISQLVEAKDKKLWIGTLGGGINVYNSASDSMVWIMSEADSTTTLLDNNVSSLLYTSLDEVWAGTDKGISIVDPLPYTITSNIKTFDISPVTVTCLVEDKRKNIWAATRHDGIYIFDIQSKKQIRHISKKELGLTSEIVDPVRHLFCDKLGRMWIASNKGLFLCSPSGDDFSLNKIKLLTEYHDFTNETIMCSIQDHEGKLWIGTQNGLLIGEENGSLFQHYNHDVNNPYSLSDRVILYLYQDHNQVMWAGTYNGINKYTYASPKFQSYKFDIQDRNKNLNVVRSLYTDDDIHIFTGTINALCVFNRHTETFEYIKDVHGNNLQNVFCIAKDGNNQLWTGNSNGLQEIIKSSKGYVAQNSVRYPELTTFKNLEITAFQPIANNLFLIATFHENGLYLWNTLDHSIKNFRIVPQDESSLPHNKVNNIHLAKNGKIWIATNHGISEFDRITLRFKNFDPAGKTSLYPGQHIVNAILEDEDTLWLATNGGLISFNPALQTSGFFTEEQGLANNNLYSCLRATDSTLWMSSNKGISEFNKRTKQFTNYDVSDGLQSNEYNQYAWYASASGVLYFGGIEGFDVLSSASFPKRSVPLVVTNIRIIDKNRFADHYPVQQKALQLHYSQNAIGFEYALLDFSLPKRNEYLCKLEGFDDHWIDNGSNTTISYTNLPPGDYRFNVKLKEHVENVANATYAFTILTPYWQTQWFAALVLITGLAILGYIIQLYYGRKMEKQRLMFEKQQAVEHERTRIATDMHDDLGAGLSRIKFLSETIGIKSQQQQPITEDVSKIKEYSHEMIDKMGEIVWALNKKNDSLSDLISFTRAYAAEYLSENNLECIISAPDDLPVAFVSGEFRRNIFLTVKEALHNIVKHANAGSVTIDIVINKNLIVKLRDNGQGFDASHVRLYSNGISNMQNRMKDIGGSLEIRNDLGTAIQLSAPLTL
ncbi:MAG: hypothetical protein C0490_02240 [Marivirga sp.]|nr:hypothetical protein [Marivirga sp.]